MSPAPGLRVRELPLSRWLDWLGLGWRDLTRAPGLAAAHGACVCVFALLLLWAAADRFWFLAGAFSGFLIVAPVLAVGLYAVSQAMERGQPVSLRLVYATWMSWRGKPRHDWRLVRFGLLLGLAGSGWVMVSAALITLLSPQPIREPMDFLQYVVAAPDSRLFALWLGLGALLAAPIFASSVVTLPLLLDRQISLLQAVLASWRAVGANPALLAVWAGVITGLTLMGLFAFIIGCLVVVPLLGHASWHAYRDLIDASALPERGSGAR